MENKLQSMEFDCISTDVYLRTKHRNVIPEIVKDFHAVLQL